MISEINEQNPQKRVIEQAIDILSNDGVIIYPTDTVYAYGCDILSKTAIEKIYTLKKINNRKPLSFIFTDISSINEYTRLVSDTAFKIIKQATPGPYTFIFPASKLVPKIAITKQKSIGVRIPDNNVALELVRKLGRPIMSASVNTDVNEYLIDPQNLEKRHSHLVDLILDAGPKVSEPSTVVDFTTGDPVIVRSGKGRIFWI